MRQLPRTFFFGLLVALLTAAAAGPAGAADTPSRIAPLATETATVTVEALRFRGLNIWSGEDLRQLLEPLGLPGGPMSRRTLNQRVNRALERLQEEGLFSDIRVGLAGDVLVFDLEEHGRVDRIRFRGNDSFDRSTLLDVLLLQPGDPANPTDLSRARRELERYYREEGYPRTRVERRLGDTDPARVTVTFHIREGGRRIINDIELVHPDDPGPLATVYRNWNLRLVLPLRPGDPYSRQAVERASRIIRQWYSTLGYLDARVETRLWRNLKEGGLDVTFRIREGVQYRLGEVRFEGNELYPDTRLRRGIALARGDVFNARTFREGLRAVEDLYHQRGYIDARLASPGQLERNRDPGARRVDFTINVREGEPVIVEDIEIHGNELTYERVIRREITLEPGRRLDGVKKQNSLRRLQNLGYFEKVEMHVDPGSAPNQRIVRVRVKEGRTGQFQFGGGFSSSSGFVGNLSVRKDNFSLYDWQNRFTGRGQHLSVSSSFGQTQSNFNLAWRDPWFNDDLDEPGPAPEVPVLLGWRVFNVNNQRGFGDDFNSELGWEETRRGGSVQTGRSLGPERFNRVDLSLSFQRVEVSGLEDADFVNLDPEDRPQGLLDEARITGDTDSFQRDISSLTLGLQRDLRNHARFPTEGYYTRLSTELATEALGGNSNYYLPQFDGRFYLPFFEPTFWAFRFNYRTLGTWKDEPDSGTTLADFPIPEFQQFFLGGQSTVRGYEYRDIAIYRVNSGGTDARLVGGGRTAFFANLEFRVKVVENTMQAFLFGDIGNVYEDTWEFNLNDTKKSAGMGLRIRTPMGPVNLTWARRLEESFPTAGDEGESRVDFNIGGGF